MTSNEPSFEGPHDEVDDFVRNELWAEVPTPGADYWDRIDAQLHDVDHDHEMLTNGTHQDVTSGGEASGDGTPGVDTSGVVDISSSVGNRQDAAHRSTGSRRKIGIVSIAAAAAIVVIGLIFGTNTFVPSNDVEIGVASDDRETGRSELAGPIANLDHWHAVYGVWDCTAANGEGDWVPAFQSSRDDWGIHSHGDGLIYIHPFVEEVAGANARLEIFAVSMGIAMNDSALVLDDGTVLAEGVLCNGEPATLHIRRWASAPELLASPTMPPTIVTTNLVDERFYNDFEVWTIAFAPLDADIPLPPVSRFDELNGWTPQTAQPTPPSGRLEPRPVHPDADPAIAAGVPDPPADGLRPASTQHFDLVARPDIAPDERLPTPDYLTNAEPQSVEFFSLIPTSSSARALGLMRYTHQSTSEVCVVSAMDELPSICSDGSWSSGTEGLVQYVVDPDVTSDGAQMVVELVDGSSISGSVTNNLAYVEWDRDLGDAVSIVILDTSGDVVEVRR